MPVIEKQGRSPVGLERCSHIAEVKGSNPFVSTTKKGNHPRFSFFYFPTPTSWCISVVQWNIPGDRFCIVAGIVGGIKNKNIKNSLGAKWNASHLAVRLCALRHWKRVSMPPTTQSLRHPLSRTVHFAPRIKTARRFTAKNP